MFMFILPDARVFITQLTTFLCPLSFHRLRCPCESRDHCSLHWATLRLAQLTESSVEHFSPSGVDCGKSMEGLLALE